MVLDPCRPCDGGSKAKATFPGYLACHCHLHSQLQLWHGWKFFQVMSERDIFFFLGWGYYTNPEGHGRFLMTSCSTECAQGSHGRIGRLADQRSPQDYFMWTQTAKEMMKFSQCPELWVQIHGTTIDLTGWTCDHRKWKSDSKKVKSF